MKLLMACGAALLLAGCGVFGSSSSPGQPGGSSVRSVNGKQCPKVWSRVHCRGNDAECINRQMDQMELYTQCHKRR